MYVCQRFQTSSPLKPLGRLKPNFMWSSLWMGEQKFLQMVLVTWPRWPPCPYRVKILKHLLRNQRADDLVTWYAVSGARLLPNFVQIMTLGWPWPILRQGQIYCLMLSYGKKVNGLLAHLSRRLTRWAYSIPMVRRPSVVIGVVVVVVRPSSSTL